MPNQAEKPLHRFWRQLGWRAAAHENSVHRHRLGKLSQLALQRVQVRLLEVVAPCHQRKVAVAATMSTEGNVEIGGGHSTHGSWGYRAGDLGLGDGDWAMGTGRLGDSVQHAAISGGIEIPFSEVGSFVPPEVELSSENRPWRVNLTVAKDDDKTGEVFGTGPLCRLGDMETVQCFPFSVARACWREVWRR